MGVDTGLASSILVQLRMSVMYRCLERRTPVGVLMTSMPRKNLRGPSVLTTKSVLRLDSRVSMALSEELVIMISST